MKVLFQRTQFPKKQFTVQKNLLLGVSPNTHMHARFTFPFLWLTAFLSKAIDLEGSKEILQIDTFTTRQRGAREVYYFILRFNSQISTSHISVYGSCQAHRWDVVRGLHAANVFMAMRITRAVAVEKIFTEKCA